MIILSKFSKLFNVIGQIMAFATVVILGLLYLNQILPIQFLTGDTLKTLEVIREYAVLTTLIICGLSFAVKRSILICVPFCILAAVAFALSFPALF